MSFMAGDKVTRVLVIKADTKGNPEIKKLADAFANMNSKISSAAGALSLFKTSFLGFSFGYVGKQIIDIADNMTLLSSRIDVLSGGTDKAKGVMEDLLGAANRSKTSIEDLAQVYSRVAASTQEAGLSTKSLVIITETLQKSFLLSGATAQEATGASIQFSQALALGALRGQELRSVLTQNAKFGDLLAKSLSTTRGGLLKMAEAGKLTSDVVLKALALNVNKVNDDVLKLKTTFGQTIIIAMNKFKFALNDINKEFDLSGKFAVGVDFILQKFGLLVIAFGLMAASQLPTLIASFGGLIGIVEKLGTALKVLATENPLLLAVTVLATAIVLLNKDVGDLENNLSSLADKGGIALNDLSTGFNKLLLKGLEKAGKGQSDFAVRLKESISITEKYGQTLDARIHSEDSIAQKVDRGLVSQKDYAKLLKELDELSLKNNNKTRSREEILADLNITYNQGAISLDTYIYRVRQLNEVGDFSKLIKGKKDLEQFNHALRTQELKEFKRYLDLGIYDLDEYRQKVEAVKLEDLNEKLAYGKINLSEYNKELSKTIKTLDGGLAFRVGLEDYLNSIGTVTENLAKAITGTFSKLEDAIFDFTKTGKFNFNDFAQSVLDDINKVLIRAYIVGPLVQGLLGAFNVSVPAIPPGGGPGGIGYTARPFAKGGVVDSPTAFSYSGGNGIMGERGSEAILPLSKASDGSLGVSASVAPVNINIINNSNADVTQKESTGPGGEKQIDVLIVSKVKDAISNGIFDRTFQTSYGLRRKGS